MPQIMPAACNGMTHKIKRDNFDAMSNSTLSKQLFAVHQATNVPSIPVVFQVHERATGQCPQWGRLAQQIHQDNQNSAARCTTLERDVTGSTIHSADVGCQDASVELMPQDQEKDDTNKQDSTTSSARRVMFPRLKRFGKILFKSRLPNNVDTSKTNTMVHEDDDDQSDSARTNETSIYSEPDTPMDVNPREQVVSIYSRSDTPMDVNPREQVVSIYSESDTPMGVNPREQVVPVYSKSDTPMDVHPREQAVSLQTVLRPTPLTTAQQTDPYDSSRRVFSSRRRLSFQRIKEVFPNADEERHSSLFRDGTSVRTMLNMFAEDSDTPHRSLTISTHSGGAEGSTGLATSQCDRPSLLVKQQEDSLRLLQIMEVFPDVSYDTVKDQLSHSSVEQVLEDLAEQSA